MSFWNISKSWNKNPAYWMILWRKRTVLLLRIQKRSFEQLSAKLKQPILQAREAPSLKGPACMTDSLKRVSTSENHLLASVGLCVWITPSSLFSGLPWQQREHIQKVSCSSSIKNPLLLPGCLSRVREELFGHLPRQIILFFGLPGLLLSDGILKPRLHSPWWID